MAVHIYYRHASAKVLSAKSRPAWFSYRRCIQNLIATVRSHIANGQVFLNVVFDGSPEDYQECDIEPDVSAAIKEFDALPTRPTVRFISGGDQRRAWRACVAMVQSDIANGRVGANDFIYLLENDYVHDALWMEKFRELVDSGIEWDYLTMYDHPDKYPGLSAHGDSARYRKLTSQIFCSGSHHWRTTPSTCATYILSTRVFLRDLFLLKQGIYDFKLFALLKYVKRRVLVSPIPSLSTHSMTEFLAPTVDWARE